MESLLVRSEVHEILIIPNEGDQPQSIGAFRLLDDPASTIELFQNSFAELLAVAAVGRYPHSVVVKGTFGVHVFEQPELVWRYASQEGVAGAEFSDPDVWASSGGAVLQLRILPERREIRLDRTTFATDHSAIGFPEDEVLSHPRGECIKCGHVTRLIPLRNPVSHASREKENVQ